jgi:hypothetical protein
MVSEEKCVSILGKWVVLEYARPSARKIMLWSFRSFNEAVEFRLKREEFYRNIGLDRKRGLTPPSPKISREEMEMFEEIVEDPELLRRVRRQFAAKASLR